MSMLCSRRRTSMGVVTVCVMVFAVARAAAQDEHTLEPQVVASGSGEVVIPATRASFSIEVTTLAASAAGASEQSARISKAVSSALQAARLSREEIAQSRLTVSPRWEYDQAARRERRTGYQATTTIQIETEHLDRLGAYIDAALDAGATEISEISFSAKASDEARRQALTQAVARARVDAETMARAGGGTLGQVLLLTTEQQNMPRPIGLEMAAAASFRGNAQTVRTSIIPSHITVTAAVVGRWRFVPDSATR
jgi:uncharacterized protein